MSVGSNFIRHELLGDSEILLHGVPCRSSRGWLGYCSIVLFPMLGGWALFDTGHFSDRHFLLDALAQNRLSPADISHIVISHLHFDHILKVPLFRNAFLIVSRAEINYAARVSAEEIDDPCVPDNWLGILRDHEMRIVEVTLRVDERTQIDLLPGHTPGGLVVFREGPAPVAVCGDVIKKAWDALNDAVS